MLCNQAVHTDREVTANRPDIIIKNKKEKTCTLIDVAIPADKNVVQKEVEEKLNTRFFFVLKLSPCLECKLASFGYLPGVQFSKADVSEPSVGSIFKAG